MPASVGVLPQKLSKKIAGRRESPGCSRSGWEPDERQLRPFLLRQNCALRSVRGYRLAAVRLYRRDCSAPHAQLMRPRSELDSDSSSKTLAHEPAASRV